jgi:Prokaryotic phospholipase A2
LSSFVQTRNAEPDNGQLDWTSDGCSDSPDKPLGFNFVPGCYRHDFGYRNYKKQGRFNETTRKTIDDNGSVQRTVFLARHAGRRFGGMGTVSDDT